MYTRFSMKSLAGTTNFRLHFFITKRCHDTMGDSVPYMLTFRSAQTLP